MSDTEKIEDIMQQISAAQPDFAVAKQELRGGTYTVYSHAPLTLRDLCLRAFTQHGDATFLVYESERYSFAEVLRRASALADVLRHRYGIGPGERVAIAMRNCPEWIIGFIAVQLAGGTVAALNSWWSGRELEYGIRDCGARLALLDDKRLEHLAPRLPGLGLSVIVARSAAVLPEGAAAFEQLADAAGAPMPAVEAKADDIATILYTSGSTGYPKGVASDHRAIVNQLWSWLHLIIASLVANSASTAASGAAPTPPVALVATPLFHINGCHSAFLMSLLTGQKLVMMSRWSPSDALRLIETERVTSIAGVPTMAADLLNAPDRDRYDLSSLKLFTGGGAATPPERIRELREKMPDVAPGAGYGMTETNGAGTIIGGEDLRGRPASAGRPTWPLTTIRLVDEGGQTFDQSRPGRRGEIWIRSVTNMRGYWNLPDITAQTLQDGWIKTGDVGEFDADGFLYIVGRIKEIIIRGGENISCNEVEAAIFEHPDVFEACVYGIRDERMGEEVAATLVPRPGREVDPQALREFLASRLAPYKIPKQIEIRQEALPRVASGKIDRLALRQASTGAAA